MSPTWPRRITMESRRSIRNICNNQSKQRLPLPLPHHRIWDWLLNYPQQQQKQDNCFHRRSKSKSICWAVTILHHQSGNSHRSLPMFTVWSRCNRLQLFHQRRCAITTGTTGKDRRRFSFRTVLIPPTIIFYLVEEEGNSLNSSSLSSFGKRKF